MAKRRVEDILTSTMAKRRVEDILTSTMTKRRVEDILTSIMTKRRVEDIFYDESFKNKKCNKIKIKLGIHRGSIISPR